MAYVRKEYTQSDAVTKAQEALRNQLANKPGQYTSQWQQQLDDVMGKILNREKFSYDLNGDALYNQYKDQYTRQGKLAMQDTMGQAAALTGGYGNSYAQQVGQQTYQGYLGQLNDRIPELYNLALSKYQMEGDALKDQYGILGAREEQDYGRYRDKVSDYNSELGRLQGVYDNERAIDYGQWQYEDQQGYARWQDARKLAQSQVDELIAIGGSVSPELLAAAGYDPSYLSSINAVRAAQAAAAKSAAYSGGGGSGSAKVDEGGNKLTYSDVRQTAGELRQKGASVKEIYQYIENTVNSGDYKPTADIQQDMKDLKNNYMRTSGR